MLLFTRIYCLEQRFLFLDLCPFFVFALTIGVMTVYVLKETYGNSSPDSSDEEFGASSASSDEDFNDIAPPKRRRITCDKTMVLSPNRTPITNSTVETKEENHEKIHHLSKRTRENLGGGGTNKASAENVSSGTGTKKSAHKRLGEAVTQVLCSTGRLSPFALMNKIFNYCEIA